MILEKATPKSLIFYYKENMSIINIKDQFFFENLI